jgi:hypothetical protein
VTRRAPTFTKGPEWPLHVYRIIRAAERECPRGHASALRELIALAYVKVPSRGVYDPAWRGEHELFTAIETVANRHLGLARARAGWRSALRHQGVEASIRDEIERAALEVQTVSDTAYFYAGLAFGVCALPIAGSR